MLRQACVPGWAGHVLQLRTLAAGAGWLPADSENSASRRSSHSSVGPSGLETKHVRRAGCCRPQPQQRGACGAARGQGNQGRQAGKQWQAPSCRGSRRSARHCTRLAVRQNVHCAALLVSVAKRPPSQGAGCLPSPARTRHRMRPGSAATLQTRAARVPHGGQSARQPAWCLGAALLCGGLGLLVELALLLCRQDHGVRVSVVGSGSRSSLPPSAGRPIWRPGAAGVRRHRPKAVQRLSSNKPPPPLDHCGSWAHADACAKTRCMRTGMQSNSRGTGHAPADASWYCWYSLTRSFMLLQPRHGMRQQGPDSSRDQPGGRAAAAACSWASEPGAHTALARAGSPRAPAAAGAAGS